jgi:autotransporter-associated beta strand protein
MFESKRCRHPGRPAARRFRPCLEALGQRVLPATQVWTGLGTSLAWTDPDNWASHQTPSGGGLFSSGDDLVFPAGARQLTNFNDFGDDTQFHTITIQGSGYDLQGHKVALLTSNGENSSPFPVLIATNTSGSNQVDFSIDFGSAIPPFQALNQRSIEVDSASATLALTGSLHGVFGFLFKEGSGTLALSGASDYHGVTLVDRGVLRVSNASALGSPFSLIQDDGTTVAGGTLELQGQITTADALQIDVPFLTPGVPALRNVSGVNSLTGSIALSGNGATPVLIEVDGSGGNLTLTGPITNAIFGGSADLNKSGPGQLTLAAANSSLGTITVTAGTLLVKNNAALGSTQAGTTVQAGATLAGVSGLTVAEPVTLQGQSATAGPAGLAAQSGAVNWAGAVTLAGSGALRPAFNTRLLLNGGLTGSGSLLVGDPIRSAGTAEFDGGAFSYAGPTTVARATLLVNVPLTESDVTLTEGGFLGGTGSVPNVAVQPRGTVSPGAPGASSFLQGTLRVANNITFGAGSALHIDLSQNSSRLPVSSTLRVDGAVNLGGAALNVGLHFLSAVGDTFTILDNRGGQDVVGAFANLPSDGSTFTVTDANGNLEKFSINYHGGGGHSVVLRHIDTATMARDLRVTPAVVRVGQAVTLSGQLVDPDPRDRLTLVIDWGDGGPAQTFHPGTRPFRARHRYHEGGTYVLHVSWSDDHGQGASQDLTVRVVQGSRWRGALNTLSRLLGRWLPRGDVPGGLDTLDYHGGPSQAWE